MNSGLPSLIDAIFGKKDLASVSLDEIQEVIQEFPSFNAVHFLLSKKLELENHADYEKISLRTALYFNNPLWLQSLLEENHPAVADDRPETIRHSGTDVPNEFSPEPDSPENVSGVIQIPEPLTEPIQTAVIPEPEPENIELQAFTEPVPEAADINVADFADPEPDTAETNTDENTNQEPAFSSDPANPVTSFDELMSKYHIQIEEEPVPEKKPDTLEKSGIIHENNQTTPLSVRNDVPDEMLNEYGIFEEVVVRRTDHDMEAFDRPFDNNSGNRETGLDEMPPMEFPVVEPENIVENPVSGNSHEKSDRGDYEAFDRPAEKQDNGTNPAETAESQETLAEMLEAEADDTSPEEPFSVEPEPEINGELQALVSRIGEKQKRMPLFDAKKAESIVFTPYHMVDYFASQGIKLVLEDHPADNFGKQLKSFTDWLKVMKKLPAQPAAEKMPEKDADRIRHFAAHSVEERDILTESMAEVLAKQGMYENAIALFQKLSLIYPPKSAYFASRIEQLKASLP